MAAGPSAPRPLAVSVDMDAPLDYTRFYGLEAAPASEPFLADAVPRFLDLFAELGLKGTFFGIGRDAESREGARWYRRLTEAGHEVANHTHGHPTAFRVLSRQEKAAEIDRGAKALEDACGRPVVGFRAPAYDLDPSVLELLLERGYLYDASVNPTPFLLPMKAVIRWKARRWNVGLGRPFHGFSPKAPRFHWRRGRGIASGAHPGAEPALLELPLSVVPGLRFPFYGTITQILTGRFGEAPFRWSLAAVRRSPLPLSYELHALELGTPEGGDAAEEAALLRAVPGYGASAEAKREVLRRTLGLLAEDTRPLTLEALARELRQQAGLPRADAA